MSTHNIPLSIQKKNSPSIILYMQLCDIFRELKNEFKIAVVNEPSVFGPLKFYCTAFNFSINKADTCT